MLFFRRQEKKIRIWDKEVNTDLKEQGAFPSEKDPKLYDICNIPFIDETTASSPDVIKQIVAHGYVKQPMRKKPHSII